jgi:molybdopterin converting factor small subunit
VEDVNGGRINVTLVLHPLLATYSPRIEVSRPQSLDVAGGSSVGRLLTDVCGLPPKLPLFVALNGRQSGPDAVLHDGDRVRVFMPLSGG